MVKGGPDNGDEERGGDHEADGDPADGGVARAGAVDMRADAGDVERVPGEVFGRFEEDKGNVPGDPAADFGKEFPERGVAAAKGVDQEIAEGETEAEAAEGCPADGGGRGRGEVRVRGGEWDDDGVGQGVGNGGHREPRENVGVDLWTRLSVQG